MKKLIIIMLFLTISCKGQERSVVIDSALEPYVEEFVKEANKRGVDGVNIVLNINKIVFVDMVFLGYYDIENNNVLINSNIKDKAILRAVVFHEIGHTMGKMHTCKECLDLMSAQCYTDYKKLLYKYDEIWQKELDKFFKNVAK